MKLNLTQFGHKPPADARKDLFVNTAPNPFHQPAKQFGHLEFCERVDVSRTGAHPKLNTRWAREGHAALESYVFYRQ